MAEKKSKGGVVLPKDEEKKKEKTESADQPLKTTPVLVRIVEWSCWLPERDDPNMEDNTLTHGMTAFRALPGETLQELKVIDSPVKGKGVGEDGEEVSMQLFAFRAVLARPAPAEPPVEDIVTPQPSSEESRELVKDFMNAQAAANKIAMPGGAHPQGMPRDHRPSQKRGGRRKR